MASDPPNPMRTPQLGPPRPTNPDVLPAMISIVEVLKPFDANARSRIVQAVCIGLDIPSTFYPPPRKR